MIEHLPAFFAVSAAVIMTPGQDTGLTLRNTLAGGRRGGVFTALGVAAGQAVWTVAASAGVVALLSLSATAFAIVRFAGAAYLVLLGARALFAAFRVGAERASSHDATPAPRLPSRAAFRQGLLSNLANPKMVAFFTSLLPQFTGRDDARFAALLLLGAMFCTMTLLWLALIAATIARAGVALRRAGVRRALEGVMGAVLVAFGLRLALDRS